MKNIFTFLLLFVVFTSNAQKFDLTPEGYEPVVVELQDKSAEQIYTGIIKYIHKSYKNPSDVLKGDIKNEYIRLDGFMDRMWCYKAMGINNCVDQNYTVEINIKEGKLRMTFIPNHGYVAGTTNKLMYTYKSFFKKDGSIRNIYTDAKESLDVSVNNMLNSIVEEVNGKSASNNDW